MPYLHAVVLTVGKKQEVVSIDRNIGRTGYEAVGEEAARPFLLQLKSLGLVRSDDTPVHVRVDQSSIGPLCYT